MKAQGFDYLKKITAVDYISYLEVVYLLYNLTTKNEEIVKVKIDVKDPEIDSVMGIYKAADWYERELSEMFGIKIKGRNAKRLLLEEWNGVDAPLRKSFIWGKDYKKMNP
ncbi:MAG: NADH-quinone oxidoreductase subunit C [Candidatus Micrarchaeales archaeon]